MSNTKEIKTQISSIKSTQKITRAMELVAASKMRKAQDRMSATKPYAQKMRDVIRHVANANIEVSHPFLEQRPEKTVGYIVVSTDRGLCGGLNINLFKKVLGLLSDDEANGRSSKLCLFGSKAQAFFRNSGADVVALTSGLGDAPRLEQVIGGVRVMLNAYENNEIDKLYIVFNEFVNTMTQQPTALQLLPLDPGEAVSKHSWDYIYEPTADSLIGELLVRYVEVLVAQGIADNIACEQAARMVAMKAATDNAGDLIKDLELVYNKARQASITQELSEIVSGAAAV